MNPDSFSAEEAGFMAEAIRLARQGLYTTDPNPRVGCVIVKNAQVIGRGFHQFAGEGHAEVNALKDAGAEASGATAYVTLEPCSHFGRTPPCAEALKTAGIKEVIGAMQDPNPLVAGKGYAMLQASGIKVRSGLLEAQARALNPGFIKRMESGLPWIRIKTAVSVDGRTAMASGESQWITGAAARSDVQRYRARSSAMLTGIGTVLFDDASLTVREDELGMDADSAANASKHQPLRVVLDRQAQLPPESKLLAANASVLWCIGKHCSSKAFEAIAQRDHVEICFVDEKTSSTEQLTNVMALLAQKGCNEVMVEAGAEVVGGLIDAGLYDELIVYMAPKLMGAEGRPLAGLSLDKMSQAKHLKLTDLRMLGDDIRMIYRPANNDSSKC